MKVVSTVRKNMGFYIFIAASISLIFIAGFGVGWRTSFSGVWPNIHISSLRYAIKNYARFGFVPEAHDLYADAPDPTSTERVIIASPDRVLAGYRAIMGWDAVEGRFSIWLFDEKGEVRHIWPLRMDRYGIPSIEDEFLSPHGLAILKDGSAVVSFDLGAAAMVRIDACGEAVWVREGVFHHPFSVDEAGHIWTWRGDLHQDDIRQFIVQMDPETGSTISEISLADQVHRGKPGNAEALTLPTEFEFPQSKTRAEARRDARLHPNDVEPLSAALADSFPQFAAGDLLISLRNIDLVAVLDAQTHEIKWWQQGPWFGQHDPDFEADGRIYVFNNATERYRSDIVAIDPVTRKAERYFSEGPLKFYSQYMGTHSRIAPDMHFVVIPGEGRVLEATQQGEIVFEFNNVVTEKTNGLVMNGQWLPSGFFSRFPECSIGR